MGIETRRNGRYYYRKERHGTRVTSTYVGSGPVAALIVEYEELRKAEELYKRSLFKRQQQQIKQQATLVLGTEADVRELVKAVLIANGFHQHKRQWRKRMQHDIPPQGQPAGAIVTVDTEAENRREGLAALRAALAMEAQPAKPGGRITERDRAIAERDKRAAVRQVLAEYPSIWGHLRHFLSSAQGTMIEATCGSSDSVAALVMEKTLKAMRNELGFEQAGVLERLLIEQVVVAFLDCDYVQQAYAQKAMNNHTLSTGAYFDRRVTSAQARYLRALEALARVRRLAQPQPLQVNIGGQQVNVAGTPR